MLKRGYKCRPLAEAKWVQRMVGQLMEWVQNLGSEKTPIQIFFHISICDG